MQKFCGQTHDGKKSKRWNPLESDKCKTFAIIIIPTIAVYHGSIFSFGGDFFLLWNQSYCRSNFFFSDCIFHGKDRALCLASCSMWNDLPCKNQFLPSSRTFSLLTIPITTERIMKMLVIATDALLKSAVVR